MTEPPRRPASAAAAGRERLTGESGDASMSTTDDGGGLFGIRPILCVDNVARAIAYYVDRLGFRLGWAWSNERRRFLHPGETDPPAFALVGRGQAQFMLSQQSQGSPGVWVHLDVHTADQVDALHAEWVRRGADVFEPPSVRPWGMYEMRVRDADGHVMRVSSLPRQAAEPAAGGERPHE